LLFFRLHTFARLLRCVEGTSGSFRLRFLKSVYMFEGMSDRSILDECGAQDG